MKPLYSKPTAIKELELMAFDNYYRNVDRKHDAFRAWFTRNQNISCHDR